MAVRHPLFVANGTAGVTSPQDARLALAALLSGPGILNGFSVSGSSSGPNMKYNVAAGAVVTQRGTLATDGLYLWANDGTATVDSGAPAPTSGSRYDVIYALARNANDGFGDANSDTIIGVVVGTASSTPTVPSAPAGALVLAQALVGTNAANAAAAGVTITNVAPTATVQSGMQQTSDWNTATAPGTYYGSGAANGPTSATYHGIVTVAGSVVIQTLFRQSAAPSDFAIWQRLGTGWTAWTLLAGLDSGWQTVPVGVSYVNNGAQYRVIRGIVYMRGLIQTTSGNYAASTLITLISAGNLPAAITPTATINVPLSGPAPGSFVRGILLTNGSMQIYTSSTPSSYVDLAGFSGYPVT